MSGVGDGGEPTTTIVTWELDAADTPALLAALARYVVLTRAAEGCRNVDLAASVTAPDRFVLIEKWSGPDAQAAHFDGPTTRRFAAEVRELLARPPRLDLLTGLSAHDLR